MRIQIKSILAVLLLTFSVNVLADRGSDIFGAAIGGIILGKVLTDHEHYNRPPPPPPYPVYSVPPPVYTAPPQPVCPYPYMPWFDRGYVYDSYGRPILVERFIGCR